MLLGEIISQKTCPSIVDAAENERHTSEVAHTQRVSDKYFQSPREPGTAYAANSLAVNDTSRFSALRELTFPKEGD